MPALRILPVVLLAFAGTGCVTGVTQNPSYIPFYFPAGDIVRTHAKPGGLGYTHNFDRKAVKLEVTPGCVTNPTRTQQVLIATVFDKDGQPRRSRRVEWILDGPGNIVEVDESGVFAGRGYKVDNKYAVSYTDYFEHTLTRGNDDPRDDFTVKPGQSWCVVTSPVEGQTSVTVYAPEVYDWDEGRRYVKLVWADGGFAVRDGGVSSNRDLTPPSAASPAKLTLDVTLPPGVAVQRDATAVISLANRGGNDAGPLTVKATLPDGVELTKTDPPATRKGREVTWALDGVPAGKPRDMTLTVRPVRKGNFTFNAVAETGDGLRAERSANTTADDGGMKTTAVGTATGVAVTVTNTGGIPVRNATAFVTLPAGVEHKSGANPVEVGIGDVETGRSKTVDVPLTGTRTGSFPVRVNVTADGGLADKADATFAAARSELQIAVRGPEELRLGEQELFEVKVTNAGDTAVADVTVRASVPRGLTASRASHDGRVTTDAAEWVLPSLQAGEMKTLRLTATADKLIDRGVVTASVNGGRAAEARTTAAVSVTGTPKLVLELSEPGDVSVGGRVTYRVVVRNRGNAPARSVQLSADFSPELTPGRGSGPSAATGRIDGRRLNFPALVELPAGGSATFTMDADAAAPGDARVTAEVRATELTQPVSETQGTRVTRR